MLVRKAGLAVLGAWRVALLHAVRPAVRVGQLRSVMAAAVPPAFPRSPIFLLRNLRYPGISQQSFGRIGPVLLVAATATGCSGRIGMPEPGTQQGERIVDLWRVLFFTAVALGGLVLVLLAWCILRYRRRGHPDNDGDLPPQRRGNVPLEVVYTVVPLAIVGVIFVLSLRTDPAPAGDGKGRGQGRPLAVDVTAFRWQWRFDYPAQGVSVVGGPEDSPDLVLPTGRPVRLRVRTADVIHSFFVPGFLGKMDVVPGLDNEFDLRPTRPGRYQGYCAEFCGLDHARMTFAVRVVSPDEFTRWARKTAAAAAAETTGQR